MVTVLVSSESRYPVDRDAIRSVVTKTFEGSGYTDVEVSVRVVGKRKMAQLAEKYLGQRELHEVLSFCLEDPGISEPFAQSPDAVLRLGDVVICYPEVVRLAREDGKMIWEEMAALVEHGCQHLLGKHHE